MSALLTDSTVVCFQYDIVGHLWSRLLSQICYKSSIFFSIGEPQWEISSLRLYFNRVFVRILEWSFVGGMVPLFIFPFKVVLSFRVRLLRLLHCELRYRKILQKNFLIRFLTLLCEPALMEVLFYSCSTSLDCIIWISSVHLYEINQSRTF